MAVSCRNDDKVVGKYMLRVAKCDVDIQSMDEYILISNRGNSCEK